MSLTIFHLLSLGILSGLSLVIFREDIKKRKIRNIWIKKGFGMGSLLILFAFFLQIITLDYVFQVVLNTSISLLLGFAIWRLGFWPAGDSKLFLLFCFLLPIHFYQKTYFAYFPSFALLMNSFAVFLIFLIYRSLAFAFQSLFLFAITKSDQRKMGSAFVQKLKYFWSTLFQNKDNGNAFAQKIKDSGSKLFQNRDKLFYNLVQRIASNILFLAIIFFIFKRGPSFNNSNSQMSFLLFLTVTALINFYIKGNSHQKIDIDDLTVGMNLTEETVAVLKKDKNFFSEIGPLRAEGLEEKQVKSMRDYMRSVNVEQISIYQTIPFSPWIISGALMTVIFKGSFVHLFYARF